MKAILGIIIMVAITTAFATAIYFYIEEQKREITKTSIIDIYGFENNSIASFTVKLHDKNKAYGFSFGVYYNIIQTIENLDDNYTNFYYNIQYGYWEYLGDIEYVKYAEIHFPKESLARNYMESLKVFLEINEIEYKIVWTEVIT